MPSPRALRCAVVYDPTYANIPADDCAPACPACVPSRQATAIAAPAATNPAKSFCLSIGALPAMPALFDHLVAFGGRWPMAKKNVPNADEAGPCCNPNPDFTDMV